MTNRTWECEGCGAPVEHGKAQFLQCPFCGRQFKNPDPAQPSQPKTQPPKQPAHQNQAAPVTPKPKIEPGRKRQDAWPILFVFAWVFGPFVILGMFCMCCFFSAALTPTNRSADSSSNDDHFKDAVNRVSKKCKAEGKAIDDRSAFELIASENLCDRWGRLVVYRKIDGQTYELSSFGKDGIPGTPDAHATQITVALNDSKPGSIPSESD